MKVRTAAILALSLSLGSACSLRATSPENEVVLVFAEKVASAIKDGDSQGFENFQCVPQPCMFPEVTEMVFGASSERYKFQEVLSQKSIKIVVVGPYTEETPWPLSTYTVMYIDPVASGLAESGEVNQEYGVRELYRSFLQTQVTVVNNTAKFHRTPFHLGAHHPYVEEYGEAPPNQALQPTSEASLQIPFGPAALRLG